MCMAQRGRRWLRDGPARAARTARHGCQRRAVQQSHPPAEPAAPRGDHQTWLVAGDPAVNGLPKSPGVSRRTAPSSPFRFTAARSDGLLSGSGGELRPAGDAGQRGDAHPERPGDALPERPGQRGMRSRSAAGMPDGPRMRMVAAPAPGGAREVAGGRQVPSRGAPCPVPAARGSRGAEGASAPLQSSGSGGEAVFLHPPVEIRARSSMP